MANFGWRAALSERVARSGWNGAVLPGGGDLLTSPAGLAGFSVNGTLLVAGPNLDAGVLAACRQIASAESEARTGITLLPDLLVACYLGHASEAARNWIAALWQVLRPTVIGRAAQTPRIWNT
jgi:urease accessory protein